ncbi:hypothetical protein CL614_04050 [archaeon]|nr:hypothetical protein [archaeon]|tara:strand:+ start:555 stop:734 length:180 start_codon:yes stop_codon:yes gene_type:complete
MKQDKGAVRGLEGRRQKDLAKTIKKLHNEYGDSWIYRYEANNTVSITGDINNFDIAKID